MNTDELLRRRSPGWVREMSDSECHSILFRFAHMRESEDLTDRQEWLHDALVSELEYRRRHARPAWKACSCQFCFSPFPDALPSEAAALGGDPLVALE